MNITSQLVVEVVARALLLSSTLCGANPQTQIVSGGHVRPQDRQIAGVVAEAARRSATVRHLLRRLDDSDVLVLVERGDHLDVALAGQLAFMTSAGGFRYVRVQLQKSLSALQQIAALGHELRHAVEVAEAPHVVDAGSLQDLYERIGFQVATRPRAFESHAALAAERQVRKDLSRRASPRSHVQLASPTPSRESVVTPVAYTTVLARAKRLSDCPSLPLETDEEPRATRHRR